MTSKIHPRFPDYEIHSDGRVFRIRPANLGRRCGQGRAGEIFGRILRKSGYRQFKLCTIEGTQAHIRANRLIAETFHGPAPTAKHHAAHNDGVRLNNHKDNIRWATPKENIADCNVHGTRKSGFAMPNAALTEVQLAEVRASFTGKHGEIRALAKRFGTGYSTMNRIVHGLTYSALEKRAAQ